MGRSLRIHMGSACRPVASGSRRALANRRAGRGLYRSDLAIGIQSVFRVPIWVARRTACPLDGDGQAQPESGFGCWRAGDALPCRHGARHQLASPSSRLTYAGTAGSSAPPPATARLRIGGSSSLGQQLSAAEFGGAPELELPAEREGEVVLWDSAATGLTLRRPPLAILRPVLAKQGWRTAAVETFRLSRRCRKLSLVAIISSGLRHLRIRLWSSAS